MSFKKPKSSSWTTRSPRNQQIARNGTPDTLEIPLSHIKSRSRRVHSFLMEPWISNMPCKLWSGGDFLSQRAIGRKIKLPHALLKAAPYWLFQVFQVWQVYREESSKNLDSVGGFSTFPCGESFYIFRNWPQILRDQAYANMMLLAHCRAACSWVIRSAVV